MKTKTLILLPTLNEAHNILRLYKKILSLKINFDFLFIDDGSVDGTWEIIKKIKKSNRNKVFVIRRKSRKGLGKAHKDGLLWAYKREYLYLITMDTDFAHDPKYIPKLIKKNNNVDLVVGSRYLRKKSAPDWSLFRIFLSQGAHLISYLLFSHTFDSTNAFRCYNLKKINKNFISYCKSNDYEFLFTSLTILNLMKYKIMQFPMTVRGRVNDNSKMQLKHMFKSVYMMFNLYFKIKFKYNFT